MTVRWVFTDTDTAETATVELNPNKMDTPTTPRSLTWGFSSDGVLRGVDLGNDSPAEWSFSGAILTKSHYDLLLSWAQRDEILHVTDHLARTFEVLIRQFDPVERLPNATRPWRADYAMTCLLLKEIP